jgi:hypothetical protein
MNIVKNDLDEDWEFIKLPKAFSTSFPKSALNCKLHKKRMNIIYNFVYREEPALFYIDESVDIAAFINLLGVPYVYGRMKGRNENEGKDDFSHHLAYSLSLFNMAPYDNVNEEDWYKKTPYYHKTKYHLKEKQEVNKKIFCMYLEEDFCLKKEEASQPLFFKAF